ncbi:MAG: ABC transporter substrate-binding protein [Chloroflexota bacterium]|nr:MAG: ABC transporter substrate-binding protein [Chloroflexota bacterium]
MAKKLARLKLFPLLLVLVAVMVTVAACGQTQSPSPSASAKPSTSAQPSASASTAPSASASTQPSSSAAAKTPIKIGFVTAYSGPFAEIGPALEAGSRVALEELGGSIDGHPVQLIPKDDKNDPAAGVAVSRELIEKDQADIVIGPSMTGVAAATMQIYTDAKVPQLIIGSAKQVIDPKYPYAYRVTYNTDQQADMLIPYIVNKLGKKKIGIMIVDDALGTSQGAAAQNALKNLGLKETGLEKMKTGDTDVTGQMNRLKSAGTDGVFLYASGPDGAAAVRAMRDVGLQAPVVAHSGIALASFPKLVEGIDISQVYATYHTPMARPISDKVQKFAKTIADKVYKGGDHKNTLSLEGLTYDAIYVIQEAVRQSGGKTDRASLAAGLKKITGFQGLMGKVDFSKSNEGWPVENITPIKVNTWDGKTGTFEKAPGAQ